MNTKPLLVALIGCTLSSYANAQTFHPVARQWDQVPGQPTGVLYRNFSRVQLGDSGRIAFNCEVIVPGVGTVGSLLRTDAHGTPEVVVLGGEQAPGLADGVTFIGANQYGINSAGQMFAYCTVEGPGIDDTNNQLIYRIDSDGTFLLVARLGDQVPGQDPGVVYGDFSYSTPQSRFVIDNLGEVSFAASLAGPGVDLSNNEAYFKTNLGSAFTLVREGDSVPNESATYQAISRIPQTNDNGEIFFECTLEFTAPASQTLQAVMSNRGGNGLDVIHLQGDMAPMLPVLPDNGFVEIPEGLNSNTNTYAFGCSLNDGAPGNGYWDNEGATYLATDSGEFTLLNTTDRPFVDFPDSSAGLLFPYAVGKQNAILFKVQLFGGPYSSANDEYVGIDGNEIPRTYLAANGQQIPGRPAGELFPFSFGINDFMMTDDGKAMCFVNDPIDSPPGPQNVLLCTNASHELEILIATGDLIDYNPDPSIEDQRSVIQIRETQMNNNGDFAFRLLLASSGNGIFTTVAPTAPCPADLAEPFGVLDFSDVIAFITAFSAMDASADLAPPTGVFDFSDVVAFLGAFGAGCP